MFSRIFPDDDASSSRRVRSRSESYSFSFSSACRSSYFLCSSSGFSWFMIMDKSFPSSPLFVTVKLITEIVAYAIGWISMPELRVQRNSLNVSL